MRNIARETDISDTSTRLMVKNELGLKPYKLKKRQLLTDENKRLGLQRCRNLLRRAAPQK